MMVFLVAVLPDEQAKHHCQQVRNAESMTGGEYELNRPRRMCQGRL